jgi:DNA-binding response OmpR family regulator
MRILVVEDDAETGAALKVGLEAESYAVDLEQDGIKGLYRAKTNDYDFIILDNMLPGKEGSEICKELRYGGKMMPIMMLTVQSEIDRKVDILNGGADDYLTKPYSLGELSARIRAVLRRPKRMEESARLTADDLVLDSVQFTVFRGERAIRLTPKEFTLLEYLMKNQGRVVSRGAILEHVWDASADLFSNTIEAHIRSLRRKVDLRGKKKLIHTVSGRGYKLAVTDKKPK